MITMQQFMETIKYRITEGSEYFDGKYRGNLFCLDSWDQRQDGTSASIVFDTMTQVVHTVTVIDYSKDRAYRLTNPAIKDQMENDPYAWDDVKFIDLETDDDFMEKFTAIINHRPYDDRVVIPVDLPDDVMFTLMKHAHEQDITFNKLMENILRDRINEVLQENDNMNVQSGCGGDCDGCSCK